MSLWAMPKVRVLREGELSREVLKKFCTSNKNYTIPAELKYDSFGYLKGKLVAVDYGWYNYTQRYSGMI